MAPNVPFLLWLLVYPALGLELQPAETGSAKQPECEELTTSLAVNQQAILQLMRDGSHASSAMAENEARRQEAAAARDANIEELLKSLQEGEQRRSQETVEAITASTQAMQRLVQALQTGLRAIIETATQETVTGMAEMEELREEAAARDARLQEIEKLFEVMKAMVENASQETLKGMTEIEELREEAAARDARLQEIGKVIEDIKAMIENASQETLKACPDGWLRHESSCYLVDGTLRTWEDSLAYCRSLGGDLAKITSAEEHVVIKAHLRVDTYLYHWIGLNDRATEGHFVWTDGTTPTYTAWRGGEPNGGGGSDCVYMSRDADGKWYDNSCSASLRPVCERPVHA